jgi:hypothetical protein
VTLPESKIRGVTMETVEEFKRKSNKKESRSGRRDGKKGRPMIVYGLMTDEQGRPVALEAYPGDTEDPSTVPEQAEKRSRLSRRRLWKGFM